MKSWDQDRALDAVGGDAQFLSELAGIFCAASSTLLKSLEESIAARASHETADTAHLMWSSARSFSVPEVEEAALAVEQMARRKKFDGIRSAFDELRQEIVQLTEALAKFRNGHSSLSGAGERH
ncbi:MAG TPA: Hpt domain-containing protein [Candidatus Acidoferrales bacterium]|nr:Hpt domain-containing protein [Candidatus Acidoferrales bacterium]